jgi:hypothetical protein
MDYGMQTIQLRCFALLCALSGLPRVAFSEAPLLERLADLDDTFEGATLDRSWTVLNGQQFKRKLAGGRLLMTPIGNTVWYMDAEGPGLVKLVTGNFRLTSIVRARKSSDPTSAADNGFQFAGLIARDPASGKRGLGENYVFNVVGYRGDYFSVETKSTANDVSTVTGPPWDNGDAELRLCRIGSQFGLLRRTVGGKVWEVVSTYLRSDLPTTLQVGVIAYSFTDKWNLEGGFEGVHFAPVSSEADCLSD